MASVCGILILLSIYFSVIYGILVYHLVVNRKIKGVEKIGWIGLICFMVFLFLVISSRSYLMPWLVLVFLIFCVVYFIGSIIVMESKWGDEPLSGKKIAKGILLLIGIILFGFPYIAIEQEQEKRKEEADSLACLPHRHNNDVDACEKPINAP